MITATHSAKKQILKEQTCPRVTPETAPPSPRWATAYVDASDRPNVKHRIQMARSIATCLRANLDSVHSGISELPKFLSQMLAFDHVIASCGGAIDLEVRLAAASSAGVAETTFHVDRSLGWIVPYAIKQLVHEDVASRERAKCSRDHQPAFDQDMLENVVVVRCGVSGHKRRACAYLRGAEEDVVKRLFDASINAKKLGSRLRSVYVEDRSIDAQWNDLRQMTRDLRSRRFDVALFEDGRPAELSVSVKARRSGRSQSLELVSSFQGSVPLLEVLPAVMDATAPVYGYRPTSVILETA
ncbi:MAG TPA: hypothetical protein VF443_01445 [Nitrospira sp.]